MDTRKCIPTRRCSFSTDVESRKEKELAEKKGRDWKEIKGRRAGNRRRGGKERKVDVFLECWKEKQWPRDIQRVAERFEESEK